MAIKKLTKEQRDLCRLITPEFRVSFPHIFKPSAIKPTDKPKYSITMLFPKNSDLMGTDVGGEPRSLKEVMRDAKIAQFGPKENWPKNLESPVVDGDDEKHAGKEGYKGHWVLKAVSNEDQKPGVVDAEGVPVTEASVLYPGCYARAYIYAYIWEYMGKQGVGFILDHVQKLREGKSFGGKKPIEQVFGHAPAAAPSEDDEEDFK